MLIVKYRFFGLVLYELWGFILMNLWFRIYLWFVGHLLFGMLKSLKIALHIWALPCTLGANEKGEVLSIDSARTVCWVDELHEEVVELWIALVSQWYFLSRVGFLGDCECCFNSWQWFAFEDGADFEADLSVVYAYSLENYGHLYLI